MWDMNVSFKTNLDGTCVDDPLLTLQCLCNRILGDNSLSCASMRRHENALISLDGVDWNLLRSIKGELVLTGRLHQGNMRGDGNIGIAWGYSNLMLNLVELTISYNSRNQRGSLTYVSIGCKIVVQWGMHVCARQGDGGGQREWEPWVATAAVQGVMRTWRWHCWALLLLPPSPATASSGRSTSVHPVWGRERGKGTRWGVV